MRYARFFIPCLAVVAAIVSTASANSITGMGVIIGNRRTIGDGDVGHDLDPREGFIFFSEPGPYPGDEWSVSGSLELKLEGNTAKLILSEVNITQSGGPILPNPPFHADTYIQFYGSWATPIPRVANVGIGQAQSYASLKGLFKDVLGGPIDETSTHVRLNVDSLTGWTNGNLIRHDYIAAVPRDDNDPATEDRFKAPDPFEGSVDLVDQIAKRTTDKDIKNVVGMHGTVLFGLGINDGIELRDRPLTASPLNVSDEGEIQAGAIIQLVGVPEPSTWLLLCTGFLGLLAAGWRRRQRALTTSVWGN